MRRVRLVLAAPGVAALAAGCLPARTVASPPSALTPISPECVVANDIAIASRSCSPRSAAGIGLAPERSSYLPAGVALPPRSRPATAATTCRCGGGTATARSASADRRRPRHQQARAGAAVDFEDGGGESRGRRPVRWLYANAALFGFYQPLSAALQTRSRAVALGIGLIRTAAGALVLGLGCAAGCARVRTVAAGARRDGRFPADSHHGGPPAVQVAAELADQLGALLVAAAAAGVGLAPETSSCLPPGVAPPPRIESCYRTYDMQVWWRTYYCSIDKCGNAAQPGTSKHGWGHAVDFEGLGSVSSPSRRRATSGSSANAGGSGSSNPSR